MRRRRLMDTITGAALIAWAMAVALLMATERADADIAHEFCDPGVPGASCPVTILSCGGPPCASPGFNGACSSYAYFQSCKNNPLLRVNALGCSCNTNLC